MPEDRHFEEAFRELEDKRPKQGLFARCYAEENGDEAKTKAKYLRLRAAQIEEQVKGDAIKLRAEQGNAEAQFKLGIFHKNGQGLPKAEQEAVNWLLKAAEQGYALAQYELGSWYLEAWNGLHYVGNLNASDEEFEDKEEYLEKWLRWGVQLEILEEWLIEAAEQGHADAQYTLGKFYQTSASDTDELFNRWRRNQESHCEDDCFLDDYFSFRSRYKNEGKKWFLKAAEQGHLEAQFTLGNHYERKWTGDLDAACKWYRKAAEQGHPDAQDRLDKICEEERKIRSTAEQGDAKAQQDLSERYFYGWGVAKDEAEGRKWLHKAAEQGDADAQYRLGESYSFRNEKEKVKWLRTAAEQGHARAQYALGWFLCGQVFPLSTFALDNLINGESFDHSDLSLEQAQSVAEAVKWLTLGVEGERLSREELSATQYRLGWLYKIGVGVTKNETEAVDWVRKAAETGYWEASLWLAKFFDNRGATCLK